MHLGLSQLKLQRGQLGLQKKTTERQRAVGILDNHKQGKTSKISPLPPAVVSGAHPLNCGTLRLQQRRHPQWPG
jgi:hypothetical protein